MGNSYLPLKILFYQPRSQPASASVPAINKVAADTTFMISPCTAVQAAKFYFAYRSGLRNSSRANRLNERFPYRTQGKGPLVVGSLAPIIAAREAEAIGEYGHEFSHG